jgi:hypothetical protein
VVAQSVGQPTQDVVPRAVCVQTLSRHLTETAICSSARIGTNRPMAAQQNIARDPAFRGGVASTGRRLIGAGRWLLRVGGGW